MKVFLGDLSYFLPGNEKNIYVPLNVAYLAAYGKQVYKNDVSFRLFKDPVALLERAAESKPQVVGLSLYYWNAQLVKFIANKLKEQDPDVFIMLGGPSIDTDLDEQKDLFTRYPADAIVPNEGEYGFVNSLRRILGGTRDPVPGATFRGESPGSFIGLQTDLAELPSPYLDGWLDPYLDAGTMAPMIQTSRLCPYTCAFCTSGKKDVKGKLRAFPIERVRDEINYIATHYKGSKETLTYVTDDNFGIQKRDLEVADAFIEARSKYGYPNSIFYYNDKRFTQTSRDLHEKLGNLSWHGVMLSLQSENPEALKAINRRNLTDEQLLSALKWAKEWGFKTSTELIFGLPGETFQSFCDLIDKCARFGFDVIQCYNLILFDGIEMNRKPYRLKHKLETRKRPRYIAMYQDEELIEADDIVVSSESFNMADFQMMMKVSFLLQYIYVVGHAKETFLEHVQAGGSLTALLMDYLTKPKDWGHKMVLGLIENKLFGTPKPPAPPEFDNLDMFKEAVYMLEHQMKEKVAA